MGWRYGGEAHVGQDVTREGLYECALAVPSLADEHHFYGLQRRVQAVEAGATVSQLVPSPPLAPARTITTGGPYMRAISSSCLWLL